MGGPRSTSIGVFVDDRLAPYQRKGILVPIVGALENFVCGLCGIDLQRAEQVEGSLDLEGEVVP